jgi:hypothetical protein
MPENQLRTNLNLLPAAYRRRVLVRKGLTLWACIAVAGTSVASLAVWRAERAMASVQDELSRFERVYAPTRMMARELEAMRKRLVALDSEEEAADGLEDDRPTLALLGLISQAAASCDGRLYVRECRLDRRAADQNTGRPQGQVLTIRGAGLEVLDITKFHGLLSDFRMFDGVEIRPITNEQIGTHAGHAFHIECRY